MVVAIALAARASPASPIPPGAFAAAHLGGVDLASVLPRRSLGSEIEWCLTSRQATRTELDGDTCRWRSLTPDDVQRGFERGAVWMRLRVSNSSDRSIERWLQIGYPRVSLIQAHYQSNSGPSTRGEWIAESIGYDVPRATRKGIVGEFGVIPLRIPAGGETPVWVRVQSDALMSLEATLWEPDAFRVQQRRADVFLALALGGLALGVGIAFFAYLASRDLAFLMFGIGLIGQALIETTRSGFLHRYLWPEDRPFPLGMSAVGGALVVIGFVGYISRVLPPMRERRVISQAIRGLTATTLFFQAVATFVDPVTGTMVWGFLLVPLVLLVGAACFMHWREGDQSSRWNFLACLVLAWVALIRVPSISGYFPAVLVDTVAAPLLALAVTGLVMLSLVARMTGVQHQLTASRTEAAAQVAFLARMSHELRTPLDNILGNAQLLQRKPKEAGEGGGPAQAEVAGILQSGRHLLGLVDEILDYARGVSGALRLHPEPVVLREFLASVETGGRLLASRHRNEFILQEISERPPPSTLALLLDRGRLRQIIDNLLANAARHTHDGVIRLDYRLTRAQPKRWRIDFSLADTGEGIAAEDITRIFRPFERAGRAAQYGGKGAGMGLAIARQLVELMGGEINVESQPGKGAVFRFSIVAESINVSQDALTRQSEGLSAVAGYEGRRRTVLLVDDEPGSRAILAGAMKNAGFEVFEAESGHAALARLSTLRELDAVVTDQFMSDGDGWVVLEGVSRQLAGTPVLLVSAAPPMAPKDWPRELRFAAVFLKPLDHTRFLRTLGNLLELVWLPEEGQAVPREFGVIVKPGRDELAELAAMVEFGEVTAIGEWARRLRQRMPIYADFADRVEIAATDLDFDTLNSLVDTSASSPVESSAVSAER